MWILFKIRPASRPISYLSLIHIYGDMGRAKEVLDHEQVINYLNHQITAYLVRINALALDDRESRLVGSLYHVVNDLERIGDHAENIVEYTRNHVENGVSYSDAALAEMRDVSDRVDTILHDALYILSLIHI